MSLTGCFEDLSQLMRDWREVTAKDDLKVLDPKVPLSIERTLLRWLRSAVILSSLSVFLLHLGDKASRLNGSLVAIAALIMVTVPIFKFLRRSLDVSKAKAVQPMTDRGLVQVVSFILAGVLSTVLLVSVVLPNH
mmetsp:Transcript_144682/g.204651  ORF Transcript_144682/g.204651 Transcript_144682/m.204651 type:complete len:135 (-) Transcript_144682:65-469(-)|eukprot:symbB.v1.2.024622.t1/scaffold2344.1/size81749/9